MNKYNFHMRPVLLMIGTVGTWRISICFHIDDIFSELKSISRVKAFILNFLNYLCVLM